MTLQSDTSFKHHTDGIVTKANQTLAFLRTNLKICSTKTKDLAHKSLVRPLLEYARTAWDPATWKDISRTERVQRQTEEFVSHRYHNPPSVDGMLKTLS